MLPIGGIRDPFTVPSRRSDNYSIVIMTDLFTIGSDDEIDVELSEDDEEREDEWSTKKKSDNKRKSRSFSFDFDDGENIVGHRYNRLTEIVDDNEEDDDNDNDDDDDDEDDNDDEIEDDTIRTMVRENPHFILYYGLTYVRHVSFVATDRRTCNQGSEQKSKKKGTSPTTTRRR